MLYARSPRQKGMVAPPLTAATGTKHTTNSRKHIHTVLCGVLKGLYTISVSMKYN